MAQGDVEVNLSNLNAMKGPVFDGVDDTIAVDGVVTSTAHLNNGAIGMWVKFRSDDNAQHYVFTISRNADTTDTRFQVQLDLRAGADRILTRMDVDGVKQWKLEGTADALDAYIDKWVHILVNHDGTRARIYINGTEDASLFDGQLDATSWWHELSTATNVADKATFGAVKDNGASSSFYEGALGTAQIYEKSLTPTQITALATQNTTAPGLIHEWNWLDGTYVDSVGSANGTNSGTFIAAPDDSMQEDVKDDRTTANDHYMIAGVAGGQVISTIVEEA
jgi:hypothetical protein|tara:strand:+ start:1809 stop:2645 length:837 start_codon:yes stop_codon:yes gene_type:complete